MVVFYIWCIPWSSSKYSTSVLLTFLAVLSPPPCLSLVSLVYFIFLKASWWWHTGLSCSNDVLLPLLLLPLPPGSFSCLPWCFSLHTCLLPCTPPGPLIFLLVCGCCWLMPSFSFCPLSSLQCLPRLTTYGCTSWGPELPYILPYIASFSFCHMLSMGIFAILAGLGNCVILNSSILVVSFSSAVLTHCHWGVSLVQFLSKINFSLATSK